MWVATKMLVNCLKPTPKQRHMVVKRLQREGARVARDEGSKGPFFRFVFFCRDNEALASSLMGTW